MCWSPWLCVSLTGETPTVGDERSYRASLSKAPQAGAGSVRAGSGSCPRQCGGTSHVPSGRVSHNGSIPNVLGSPRCKACVYSLTILSWLAYTIHNVITHATRREGFRRECESSLTSVSHCALRLPVVGPPRSSGAARVRRHAPRGQLPTGGGPPRTCPEFPMARNLCCRSTGHRLNSTTFCTPFAPNCSNSRW